MSKESISVKENSIRQADSKLDAISGLLDMGWWEIDLRKGLFTGSETVVSLLNLPSDEIEIGSFYKMIREDYRVRIADKIQLALETESKHLLFPIYVKDETVWVEIRYRKNQENGIIAGLMLLQNISPAEKTQISSDATVKNLIYQLGGISKSLFAFLQNDNLDNMVNHILSSLVTYYSAERAYIFEFNWKDMNQSCTYEAVSRKGLEEIQNLHEMFFEPDTWWNTQILSQRPIILNSLDDLPEWDDVDREVLAAQDIKSLMVVPFVSRDNTIWGYAGIDIVDKQRDWTEEDFQWFSSLMHIINISFELAKSKQQVQTDKDYLQNLYEHMPIGFLSSKLIYDENNVAVDFVFTEANKEVERIIGKPVSEIIGLKGSESSSFRDLDLMLEVVNTNKSIELDLPMPMYNKHCRVIKFSLRKDEVISLLMDVTDVMRSHKALEENEQLLRTIFANLPAGFELFSREGELVQTNEKALEILGLSKPTSDDQLNIFDHPMIPPDVKRKMKKGETVDFNILYDFNKIRDFYNLDEPDRPIQNLTLKIAPIFDDQKEILYYLLLIINNTETTNAYLKIQEFEEYFSLIANLAKVGYFKWNLSTQEGFGISQWYTNLDMPTDTVMTDNLEEMYSNLHIDDFMLISDFYNNAMLGKESSFEQEVRVLDEEGRIKWLRCTLTVKTDSENKNKELIGVSYDITELKEMILAKNKAEALDKLKSAFLANMSHEIRTPLNSIIGFSDLLAETDNKEEQQEYIAIIQRNNELLLKLVTDILDLSKIESGTFDFVKKEIAVKALCDEVVQSFKTKEMPENVQLLFDESTPDLFISTDPNRVKQVLFNFITNALKFTKEGYIKLGYEKLPNSFVKFYVEDTGIGISQDNINTIFDRFVKLNSFAQGTGLGLSICKSLIEEMGGSIGVESEPGKGSCFWFSLPKGDVEADQ